MLQLVFLHKFKAIQGTETKSCPKIPIDTSSRKAKEVALLQFLFVEIILLVQRRERESFGSCQNYYLMNAVFIEILLGIIRAADTRFGQEGGRLMGSL